MPNRTYEVARMTRDQRSAVIAGLARAFYDDPLFGFFIPDPIKQSKGLLAFMGAAVIDAVPFAEIWVASTDDKIACAAVWLPPGSYPRGARRDIMTNVRGLPSFARAGRRLRGAVRLLNATDKAHHEIHEPHFYLALLGTDPAYQRSGAGHAALAPVLERCDTEGLSAYLETQKEENIAYYARHAFDVVQKIEVRGVPPVWTLLRKPR